MKKKEVLERLEEESKEARKKEKQTEKNLEKHLKRMIVKALWCLRHSVPKSVRGRLYGMVTDASLMNVLWRIAANDLRGLTWGGYWNASVEWEFKTLKEKMTAEVQAVVEKENVQVILPTDDKIVVLVDGEVLGWYNPDTGKIEKI